MKKLNKFLLSFGTLTTAVAPIAAVVSCGANENVGTAKAATNGLTRATSAQGESGPDLVKNPFQYTFEAGKEPFKSLENVQLAGHDNKAFDPIDATWGFTAGAGNFESPEKGVANNRQQDGKPVSLTNYPVDALWNWSPEIGTGTVEEFAGPNKRLDYLDAGKKTGSYRTKMSAGPGIGGIAPSLDRVANWPDLSYNRASVPLQQRTLGEKVNDTAGAFASMDMMATYNAGASPEGMIAGKNASATQLTYTAWQYIRSAPTWGAGSLMSIPSSGTINAAHRNGVPMLGRLFLMHGGIYDYRAALFNDPGPKGDYPVIKGLVELANYIGLDGYWIDWEDGAHTPNAQKNATIKAWKSYAEDDAYTPTEGSMKGQVVSLAEENKEARKKFNYKPIKQIVGLYNFGSWTVDEFADIKFRGQNHGGDAFAHGTIQTSTFKNNSLWQDSGHSLEGDALSQQGTRDRYFANSAINFPEDNFLQGMNRLLTAYYQGSKQAAYANGQDEKHRDLYQRSLWTWCLENDGDAVERDLYNAYSGDVRYSAMMPSVNTGHAGALRNNNGASDFKSNGAAYERSSLGTLFRERTPIIGNHDWATTFDMGKGSAMSLWGSDDILNSVAPAGKSGWKSMDMQSILPTYRWYMDFFDMNGRPKYTDNSLNPYGKLEFAKPVQVTMNHSAKKAYMGGTTLDYSGKLRVGESFENKLYASMIPVKTGDKFSIVMKDNFKNENETIVPELALWEANGELNAENYKSDGTEADPYDPNFKLGWGHDATHPWHKRSPLIAYNKDVVNDYVEAGGKINKTIVSHEKVEKLSNGWLKVTYDLAGNEGKTITSFGIKATGKAFPNNINHLSLGKMSYDAAAETAAPLTIKGANVSHVWDTDPLWRRARIEWTSTLADGTTAYDPKDVRYYLVFYKNAQGVREGLAWTGAQQCAYLNLIDKTRHIQNVEIVAVGNDYSVLGHQDVALPLDATGAKG